MAINVLTSEIHQYMPMNGQTDGNETIFKLNPGLSYLVEAYPTVAGSGTLKITTSRDLPTDFSAMSPAYDGTQSGPIIRCVDGCSFVGFDVATGTWNVNVRRV